MIGWEVIWPDGSVFTDRDGIHIFDQAKAHVIARAIGGTVRQTGWGR